MRVVPPHSAAPPNHENRQTLHADHSSMSKFSSRDDPNYKMVVVEVQAMIESFKTRQHAASGNASSAEGTCSVSHVGNNTHGAIAMYGKSTLGDGARIGKLIHKCTKVKSDLLQETRTILVQAEELEVCSESLTVMLLSNYQENRRILGEQIDWCHWGRMPP